MRALVTSRRQTVARVIPNIQSGRWAAHQRPGGGGGEDVELLQNGGFDANIGGWPTYQASIQWLAGGLCEVTQSSATIAGQVYQSGNDTIVGKNCRLSATYRNVTATNGFQAIMQSVSLGYATMGILPVVTSTSFVTQSVDFVALSDDWLMTFNFRAGFTNGQKFEIDSVSVVVLATTFAANYQKQRGADPRGDLP